MSQSTDKVTSQFITFVAGIDALFDTRIGLLDTINPYQAVAVLSNPGYEKRMDDDFSKLGGPAADYWDDLWSKRDAETLKHSIYTPMMMALSMHVLEVQHRSLSSPVFPGPRLILNMYPYRLTADEMQSYRMALLTMIGCNTGHLGPMPPLVLELVYRPWSEMGPRFMRDESVDACFLYDIRRYFLDNYQAFKETKCPKTTFAVPKLVHRFKPEDTMIEGKPADPWEILRTTYAPFFKAEFIDVADYCLQINRK